DPKGGAAPFVDQRTGGHWDITGRGVGGGPMLAWLDSVQVKWFAWAAEHPDTSIYGPAPAGPKERPEPLPPGVAEAWQKAGARIGWMYTDETGHTKFYARGQDEGRSGEVPAFRFDRWPTGGLAKLPPPPRAFGLDLLNTQVKDPGLKELADLKNLRALILG